MYIPLNIVPSLFFSPSSAFPQTDTAQLHNTQPDFRAPPSGSKQAFSQSCFQKQVQSYCHLALIHGSGAGSLKPLIYEDATESRL